MKGIILAGGAGSRLYPITNIITKQLQPIYDKPMIFYPLSMLMLLGIKEILIITTPADAPHFNKLIGNGERFGISVTYETQEKPAGIAQAYLIAEKFINNDSSILLLGDNLFHGNFSIFRDAIKVQAEQLKSRKNFAQIFAYQVMDPARYGIVEFDKKTGKVTSIEEKPIKPRSNYAIPGIYILDGSATERAKQQQPSDRGELEITDLVKSYLTDNNLSVQIIGRGMAWLDTGTPQSLLEASSYVATIEQRQGYKVACLEEVGLRMGYLSLNQFQQIISQTPNSPYKQYLELIAKEYIEQDNT